MNFQAYLLEGLASWNDDRATTQKDSAPRSSEHRLRFALNSMSQKVLGTDLFPSIRPLCAGTGESFAGCLSCAFHYLPFDR